MKKLPILLIIVTLISCNSVMKKDDKKTENKSLPLNNQWILEHFNNPKFDVISKDSYITINEDLKSFSGKGGCNNINGSLAVNGNLIIFDKIRSTKMYCENMPQENLFLKNLRQANNYKIVGGELFLYQDQVLLMTLESFRN